MLRRPPAPPSMLPAVAALAVILPLAACTQDAPESGAIDVVASESECTPSRTELSAGVTEFRVSNQGNQATELYVLRPDGSIVSERENIAPGVSAAITVELAAGDYSLRCRPNDSSDGVTTAIKVSGDAASAATDPRLTEALAAYRTYVEKNAEDSLTKTKEFAAAVKAGDVAKSKALYAPSRVGWERIEPVAESFGDLDPRIDLREADLEAGQTWTGWHVIEKALWANNTTAGMGPVADQLVADVTDLANRVRKVEITPTSMANGAKELLDEVATGKVTGEEEAFSHTDFVDMKANVDGAQEVFRLLSPVLKEKNATLATQIEAGFTRVNARLDTLRTGPGVTDFVPYTNLDDAGRRTLSADVNSLAEPLSGLAGAVVG